MRKNDILLIAGLLLAAALLFLVFRPGEEGAYVVVTQRNTVISRLPLDKPCTMEFTDDDLGSNTLVIEDGKAHISDADCGDHTCIRTGRIFREGQQIICLPHELIIEVVGGDPSGPDASTH